MQFAALPHFVSSSDFLGTLYTDVFVSISPGAFRVCVFLDVFLAGQFFQCSGTVCIAALYGRTCDPSPMCVF